MNCSESSQTNCKNCIHHGAFKFKNPSTGKEHFVIECSHPVQAIQDDNRAFVEEYGTVVNVSAGVYEGEYIVLTEFDGKLPIQCPAFEQDRKEMMSVGYNSY